ncbi:Hsp33 family molecular chaperone HslO [Aquibacillus koreensis]|uniref:33 kDa chaperonin n=1 Tax=Aquibacillus koreensis TaxID=279446 RepID=A0A9X3WQD5_9BACI|nr:Hsp33 family molecular chaperone HslO [Aquibacillus koreensis]MCT2535298.1 Hsp33 family molecular chaperone HslO [Aquibacillus koreensis]MDC3422361.1 Hsp33 family molecular chaperone HslO [Aquibacillus koreensis]
MSDYLVKATAFQGTIRAYAIQSTATVAEASRRQDTWATAAAALGRTITVTAMMGAMLKGKDKLTVKVEGDGPTGPIVADADAYGQVRGYITNPHVNFELNENGKLDVRRAVGTQGSLSVVKDLGLKDHFTGQVPIVSGEISEDFTYYFANSEQVPSAVGAGVLVNPDHSILASGGFIIQVLPGASDDTIDMIESRISSIPPISSLVKDGNSPEEILKKLLGEENIKIHETLPIVFHCHCSKERIEQAIKSLGDEEIDKMIKEDNGAEATCHFCNEQYTLNAEELASLKSE